MDKLHKWKEHRFELQGKHGTVPIQFYACEHCGKAANADGYPLNHRPNDQRGCTGVKPKLAWTCPSRAKGVNKDVDKRDYPAKKAKKPMGGQNVKNLR